MRRLFYTLLSYLFILILPAFSVVTHITLKSGATLELPKGFHGEKVGESGEILKIEDPEKTIKIFFLETEGKDLSQAIDQAWKRIDPAFKAKIANKVESVPAEGYDGYLLQTYGSDQENMIIQGKAERRGDTIWVLLTSGPQADILKRDAQLNSLFGSLKVPGMVEENLSQKSLNSITNNIDQLNEFIMKGMKELGVPGLSIAIVENDKIVFEKGYGVTKLGGEEPVTPHTLMKIGSTTKSLTTLLMAKLIEKGKFGWHTKARDLYPNFKVGDDKLSKTLTMEQLVSAGTGLPREDFSLSFNYHHLSPFQGLDLIKPTTQNKETFQYNNQLFVAAGDIAAHTAEPDKPMDQAFKDLMMEKIFRPMGMKETTFTPQANYAFPHAVSLSGEPRPLTLQEDEFTDFVNPAGGVWSNAHDMALYMITELKKGINVKGQRVFDEHNLMYRRTPQVQVLHNVYYGLGWFIIKYKGLTQISHGGATNGFASSLKFFPEKRCGFIILTNSSNGGFLNDAIGDKILELWFGAKEKPSEKLGFYVKQVAQQAEGLKGLSEPTPEQMHALLGKHENHQLGIFEIKKEDGAYILDTDAYKTKLMTLPNPKGEKPLVMIEPPFVGKMLIPLKEGSFKIVEEQHTYLFKKIK